jgi:hypothetical protein
MTGATLAFYAVGGDSGASEVLTAMEASSSKDTSLRKGFAKGDQLSLR